MAIKTNKAIKGNNNQTKEVKQFVFTSENVDEITNLMNDGVAVERYRNPWFSNEIGVRRHGISFSFTPEEFNEYVKCKTDVGHFAENHCKVKREDGSVGQIKLRDYQKDILELYDKNRFSILCGSRQIGKCVTFNTKIELESGKIMLLGELYYNLLESIQPLTILEKCKRTLYRLLNKLG